MKPQQRTFKDIRLFNLAIMLMFNAVPEIHKTKIGYAAKKVVSQIQPYLEDYQDELDNIRINHCVTDSKGAIEYDENKEYKFTPANKMKCKELEKKKLQEWDKKEFEIKPHIIEMTQKEANDMGIDDDAIERLNGFILDIKLSV